jgi:hypothetical protein
MIYRAYYGGYPIWIGEEVSDDLFTHHTNSKELSMKHKTYGVYVNNIKIQVVL